MKYYPKRGSTKYTVNYILPTGLVCDHCVLQWRYTAGNNWGVCENGTQGVGCGIQEQFGACSDISIGALGSYDGNDLSEGSERSRFGRLSEEPRMPRAYDQIPYTFMNLLGHGLFDAQQGKEQKENDVVSE